MFFRSLGLEAQTDVQLTGVRTTHNIDVVVEFRHVGFEFVWLVECKHWKTKINKVHVLALRTIVTDLGADRGVLLSEVGFQSGTVEAASLTNVRVTSLADLRDTARNEIAAIRLRELYDRVELCSERYWEIPKEQRIDHNLRPDVGFPGFSGANVIETTRELLSKAFRGTYPIKSETLSALAMLGLERSFASAEELIAAIEPMIVDLEARLTVCEGQIKNGLR